MGTTNNDDSPHHDGEPDAVPDSTVPAEALRLLRLLREREDQLQAVIDLVPNFIYVKDWDGRFLLVNKASADIYNTTVEALRERLHSELHSDPRELERMLADDREVMLTGREMRTRETFVDGHGEQRILDTIKAPYPSADTERPAVIGVSVDVTENVRAAEAQSLAGLGYWDWDIHNDILHWSDQLFTLCGVHPDHYQPTLSGYLERLPTEDRDTLEAAIEAARHNGDAGFTLEHRFRRADDVERIFRIQGEVIADQDGAVQRLLGTLHDVTERRRAEQALARSNAEWNLAMDAFDDAIYIIDLDDRVVRANRAFYALTGMDPEAVIGADITTVMHPDGEEVPCPVCKARRERRDTELVMEAEHPDNPTGRPIEVQVRVIRNEQEQPTSVLMLLHDLSATRQTESEMRLAASVFDESHEGIMITDAEGRIIRVNGAFTSFTGYSTDEAMGRTLDLLRSDRHDDSFYSAMWRQLLEEHVWEGEMWNRRRNGEVYPEWRSISAVTDAAGAVIRYIHIFTDITERKVSQERIHRLAYYDAVTGLPNRSLFLERLEQSLVHSQRVHRTVAVLHLDLDGFKLINDTLGHQNGDLLLQQVADRIGTQLRRGDTVARLSADEFSVQLVDLRRREDIAPIAQKILDAISRTYDLQGHDAVLSASMGISVYPDDGDEPHNLLTYADVAMHRAKEQGKNNYQFFTAEMNRTITERMALRNRLRRGLDNGEFRLHYQPQVDLTSGRIIGLEALVRWQPEGEDLISPARFIPVAEESGLIVPLGEWVLRTACAQNRQWQEQGLPPIRIAVNLSGRQFRDPSLVEMIANALSQTGLQARYLELEITESFLMENPAGTAETLGKLKAMGIEVSIDDFGIAYSSLSHLKHFPIDRLKVDQSFVRDIPIDKDDEAITSAIIAMGRSLHLRVLAEGVETEEQLAFLRERGCDEVQGYLFSRPLPAQECAQLLAQDLPFPSIT